MAIHENEIKRRLALNRSRLGQRFVKERLQAILGPAFNEGSLSTDSEDNGLFSLVNELEPEYGEDDCGWFRWRFLTDKSGTKSLENIWPSNDVASFSACLDELARSLNDPEIHLLLTMNDWRNSSSNGTFYGSYKAKMSTILPHWQSFISFTPRLLIFDPSAKCGFEIATHQDHYKNEIETKWALSIWGDAWIAVGTKFKGVESQIEESEIRYSRKWSSFIYSGFHDVPLAFVTTYQGVKFLFLCQFDEPIDDYPIDYQVYVLPNHLTDKWIVDHWTSVQTLTARSLGSIPVSKVIFDSSKRKYIDEHILQDLMNYPASENELLERLSEACTPTNDLTIFKGRAAIISMPRPWVVEHIEAIASSLLDLNDEWEFRRLAELYLLLDYELTKRLITFGLQSTNEAIREASADYEKRLPQNFPKKGFKDSNG